MPIRKRFVDDRHRRIGLLIRQTEGSAFPQTRADGCEVVAAHVTDERHLTWYDVAGLAFQPIEGCTRLVGERDKIDGSGADDSGNCAHLLHLCVEERHAAVEVLVSEQRSLEGKQSLPPDPKIGIPQVLEGLQEQAATCQQHHGERGLQHDEGMLEPMAAPAGSAPASIAQSFVWSYSRATQRGRQSEDDGRRYGCGGGEGGG